MERPIVLGGMDVPLSPETALLVEEFWDGLGQVVGGKIEDPVRIDDEQKKEKPE